jgi:hypothetical protein
MNTSYFVTSMSSYAMLVSKDNVNFVTSMSSHAMLVSKYNANAIVN